MEIAHFIMKSLPSIWIWPGNGDPFPRTKAIYDGKETFDICGAPLLLRQCDVTLMDAKVKILVKSPPRDSEVVIFFGLVYVIFYESHYPRN